MGQDANARRRRQVKEGKIISGAKCQRSKKKCTVTIGSCKLSKSTIAPETREETRGRGEYLYYPI
jgi:hypothetical protein